MLQQPFRDALLLLAAPSNVNGTLGTNFEKVNLNRPNLVTLDYLRSIAVGLKV